LVKDNIQPAWKSKMRDFNFRDEICFNFSFLKILKLEA
jgi:hypothetical protein